MGKPVKVVQAFDYCGVLVDVVMRDGEPWFVVNELARILGIKDIRRSVRRLDPDERGVLTVPTLGGVQDSHVVSESGMYALVLRSNKPSAKKFRKWVTQEVLPSIRKTGSYVGDWKKLRRGAADCSLLMCESLERQRADLGKDTLPHHYSNEHRLINWLLVGEFKSVDRSTLTALQLDCLAFLEKENMFFIMKGMDYKQRKAVLVSLVTQFLTAREPRKILTEGEV